MAYFSAPVSSLLAQIYNKNPGGDFLQIHIQLHPKVYQDQRLISTSCKKKHKNIPTTRHGKTHDSNNFWMLME